MHYAIVDIETTGGYASNGGITEIAIIITDGVHIVEQYETLLNPQRAIPYFITRLTGINDAMVASAPTFFEVAPRIYELLRNCIFVAHNVQFDYSFVHHNLKECGYLLSCPKLCTVRYGKKVIKGLRSYSLGNFCKAIEIPVENRHRAGGDCMATYYLLKRILEEDVTDELGQLLKNKAKEKNLPLQVTPDNYAQLPTGIGVYYFKDSKGKIIYIGKAINIKKRVASHFAGNKTSRQRQEFIRNIATITYTLVATELMSLVLESAEIKKHWPKYNKAQKQYEHQYAIYCYPNQQGYLQLAIDKRKKNIPYVCTVKNKVAGLLVLKAMVTNHSLNPAYCMVPYMLAELPEYTLPHVATYNNYIHQAIATVQGALPTYCIVDKGLQANEHSIVAVVKGAFIGMGYMPQQKVINIHNVQQHIQAYSANNYINNIVQYHATLNLNAVVQLY